MSIQSEIDRLNATKLAIKQAIIGKGQSVADTDTFASYADKIEAIDTLSTGTADATAVAGDMLKGKTAYVKGNKVTGTIESMDAQTYTPGTSAQTIAAGQYLAGNQTIAGDANLVPENIVEGKSIFGKAGTAEPAAALADELTEQDSLIEQIMTALEGKAAVPAVETVEVTIKNCDMNRVYYSSPNAEDGTLSELETFGGNEYTITCLKNSIIVVTDTYATTSASLEYLTSTTGDVIAPVMGNNNTKVRMVMASQSGMILPFGS